MKPCNLTPEVQAKTQILNHQHEKNHVDVKMHLLRLEPKPIDPKPLNPSTLNPKFPLRGTLAEAILLGAKQEGSSSIGTYPDPRMQFCLDSVFYGLDPIPRPPGGSRK